MRGAHRKSLQALGLGWLLPALVFVGACAPSTLPLGVAGSSERVAVADGSSAAPADDSMITLELNKRLIDYGAGLFKDVRTVVFEGRALLLGRVGDRVAQQKATAVASSMEMVGEVINEIHVGDESDVGTFLNDVAIEKTITDNYALDQSIHAAHYRVRAVEGVVYLIGRASDQGELQRALAVAGETGNVKSVVSHIAVGSN